VFGLLISSIKENDLVARDFTVTAYCALLGALTKAGFGFQTFRDYLQNPQKRVVILRHDIDERKHKSLEFASLENDKGIKASYYFRIVPESYDMQIIKTISNMGHEIGYHYENLSMNKGDYVRAIKDFENNLNLLRSIASIDTICMHGAAFSKHDNRLLWNQYDYRDFGILGEPYFDLDFNSVLYLTDSGQCWDGDRFTVRDKVKKNRNVRLSSTWDIINSVEKLSNHIMITTHPNRWASNNLEWLRINSYLMVKRQIKRAILMRRI